MRTRTCTIAMAVVVGALVVPAASAAAAPTIGTYTVVEGDILYGIAARAGISIDALLGANTSVKLESVIIPGQKLAIPAGGRIPGPPTPRTGAVVAGRTVTAGVGAPTTPATTTVTATAVPLPEASGQSYTVQPGDTAIGIAVRHAVSPDALLRLNKLTLNSIIFIGQQLQLPAGAKVVQTTGNARIDVVLAAAKAQIGKPYRFGYDGPDSFDCSGLVRFAFAKVGIAMLHHTLLQKNSFPAVAVADLKPGDLVFFHADFHHMGIWLGNNTMIEAPEPGASVRISWVNVNNITGAVRPIA